MVHILNDCSKSIFRLDSNSILSLNSHERPSHKKLITVAIVFQTKPKSIYHYVQQKSLSIKPKILAKICICPLLYVDAIVCMHYRMRLLHIIESIRCTIGSHFIRNPLRNHGNYIPKRCCISFSTTQKSV